MLSLFAHSSLMDLGEFAILVVEFEFNNGTEYSVLQIFLLGFEQLVEHIVCSYLNMSFLLYFLNTSCSCTGDTEK